MLARASRWTHATTRPSSICQTRFHAPDLCLSLSRAVPRRPQSTSKKGSKHSRSAKPQHRIQRTKAESGSAKEPASQRLDFNVVFGRGAPLSTNNSDLDYDLDYELHHNQTGHVPFSLRGASYTPDGGKSSTEQLSELFRAFKTKDLGIAELDQVWKLHQTAKKESSPYARLTVILILHMVVSRTMLSDRFPNPREKDAAVARLREYMQMFETELRAGRFIVTSKVAAVVLQCYDRLGDTDRGSAFWQWLAVESKTPLGPDVYGSIIHLLAGTTTPLAELEELYLQGQERFTGDFEAYHLAPDAILADRNAVPQMGTRNEEYYGAVELLLGIIRARFAHGDVRGAYLAVGVALRLDPVGPWRRVFMELKDERPLSEVMLAFAMLCRTGHWVGQKNDQFLCDAIRAQARRSTSHMAFIVAARQCLMVQYLGGRLETGWKKIMQNFIEKVTQVLRFGGIAQVSAETRSRITSRVLDVVRRAIAVFTKQGYQLDNAVFDPIIINVGGYGESKGFMSRAIQDMRAAQLKPSLGTYRSMVVAAGLKKDAELVKQAWSDFVSFSASRGLNIGWLGVSMVLNAARRAGAVDLERKVMAKYSSSLSTSEVARLEESHDFAEKHSSKKKSETAVLEENWEQDVETGLEAILADLDYYDEMMDKRRFGTDFKGEALPTTLKVMPSRSKTPESILRKIYDEMTTDPLMPVSETAEPSVTGASGLSPGELRYENWKDINSLLELAEQNEAEYREAVKQAADAGEPAPARSRIHYTTCKIDPSATYGLSDLRKERALGSYVEKPADEPLDTARLKEVREEIFRLHGKLQ